MTTLSLDELRQAAQAATPGPWEWHGPYDFGTHGDVRRYQRNLFAPTVKEATWEQKYGRAVLFYEHLYAAGDKSGLLRDADAEWIAAASPSVILALLDRLERAEKGLELLKQLRDADVIFSKGDWPLSQEIAAFLQDSEAKPAIEAAGAAEEK